MKNKLLTLMVLLLLSSGYIAQPGNGNGPPNPPPGWCQSHPNDPMCTNSVQVPLSDWYWEIGLILTGVVFIYYKFKPETKIT